MSKEFEPNENQQDVYDFIQNETGNAIIGAVAGSGKTTTLINALKLIPTSQQVLFMAFNKSICEELKERVPQTDNIHVRTVHSFGMSVINETFGTEISSVKYNVLLRDIIKYIQGDFQALKTYSFSNDQIYLAEKMSIDFKEENVDNPASYMSRVIQLCSLGRLNLIDLLTMDHGVEQLDELSQKHNIQNIGGESYRAWILIKLGMSYTARIDFTDMVFLPIALNLQLPQYDIVMIDEVQDLNACQREIMIRATRKDTGRFIGVGDKAQAIYGFSGADAESFDKLTQIPNTKLLPLSVCYRCGINIIKKAQNITPEIQPFKGAHDGEVDMDSSLAMIREGDMVLCRNTYPLVRLCLKFLTQGKKASIKGTDIGKSLITFIKSTHRKREEWNFTNMFSRMYKELEGVYLNLMTKESMTETEAKETNMYSVAEEKIKVIEMLSKGCDKPEHIIKKIEELFSDDSEGIVLSTIHKSKGLEAHRVFIIHPELMPSKYAKKDWEKVQEDNLRYVAYTRAKNYLGFIQKDKFDAWGGSDEESMEDKVEKVKESDWRGEVDEKIPVVARITMIRTIENQFGSTYLFELLDDEGNLYSKFGKINKRFIVSNHKEIEEGVIVAFNGTVKKHRDYKGEKITELSNLSKHTENV